MAERPVALLLPGQGAQYPRMAVPLYQREPLFRVAVDEVLDLMGRPGAQIREDWLGDAPALPLDDGRRAQPLLFAIGYGVGRVLQQLGLRPAVLLGHSIGELAAAALAGVFDLPSAARILLARSGSLSAAPAGGMLAVAAAPERIRPWLDAQDVRHGVAVGAVNAPTQTILAGPEASLARTEQALRAAGLVARRVRATEPWHSPALREAALAFQEAVAAEPLHPPRIPILSARTGRTVTAREAVDPAFWAGQMAEPVLYWEALSKLLDSGDHLLVETGPGMSLSAPARRHPAVRSGRSEVVCMLPDERQDCWGAWQTALDRLARLGATDGRVTAGRG
ncbi:acyltransferase domain-containing protein [Streptomyces sp. enrichment culture]|uniref:acyltransferase domain-containing protein n=1 Tax=Streptomyces sp. enrichment culture TaxID=1795815 RepID=UPI003F57A770